MTNLHAFAYLKGECTLIVRNVPEETEIPGYQDYYDWLGDAIQVYADRNDVSWEEFEIVGDDHLNKIIDSWINDVKITSDGGTYPQPIPVTTWNTIATTRKVKPMNIAIFTDGSCSGNPGPGGWAARAFVINAFGFIESEVFTIHGYQADTTNNRMELVAVGRALREVVERAIPVLGITIVTDSANVIGWLSQGWKRQDPKIREICEIIDAIIADNKLRVRFNKVKGHDTDTHNIDVDKLAVNARNEGIAKRGA